jgi:hypothetical protein
MSALPNVVSCTARGPTAPVGAPSSSEHAHTLADARQGEQPPCHMVEEPHLVTACGNSAEQAGNALLGLVHVHATLPPLDSTEQPQS